MSEIIVETHDLVKVYGDGAEIRALDGTTLALRQGELVAIMGPSGSGKSTLLHIIGALDRPTSGQVLVGGEDLSSLRDLDTFRARQVGFVFQLHNLIPTLSALENIEVPMYSQPIPPDQRRKRAQGLLEAVGLGDRLDHLPNMLSGGQRQKVAIARALANDPAIILADEPTGNLDTKSNAEIMQVLRELNRTRGTTIIVVTHDAQIARMTQRILTIEDGRIVDEHAVGNVLTEDLRELARSHLGRLLLQGKGERLKDYGLGDERGLTPQGEFLKELLVSLG